MLTLLLVLVFLSGAAGLLYEVVWTRVLVHTLGSTAQAVSSILAAFLGGLALGAAWLGRRAERTENPLALYAGLEAVIALYALSFPWLVAPFQALVLAAGPQAEAAGLFLRFVGTFVLLLPATAAMGGTIPVLCRFAVRSDDRLGGRVGTLYAINTTGAVVGCLAAGFWTIRAFGVSASLQIGAALNLGVAIVAGVLARNPARRVERPPDEDPGEGLSGLPWLVLVVFALSGFTALGYEILWTRVLVFFVKSITYGFSFMLATFLAGLVLGSWAATTIADRRGVALPLLAAIEIVAGLAAFGSIRLLVTRTEELRALAPAVGGEIGSLYAGLAFLVVATILPAGILFGATFPLAVRLVASRANRAAGRVGMATAANTGGAILGAFLTGFVLLPAWGVVSSMKLLVAVNVLAGATLALAAGRRVARPTRAVLAVAALLVLVAVLPSGDFFRERLGEIRPGKLIFVDEGEDVIVTVYEERVGDETARTLYVNGSSYTGSRFFARRYMKTMGHLPLLLCEKRERALVICLGTGMTLSALACHGELEAVACSELSRGVRAALPLFHAVNDRVADNPRARIEIQDGRHFLLAGPEMWDVITLEPPPPLNAGVGDLYSKEFYEICRDRLAPGGVLCQWFPMHSQTVEEYEMGLATFAAVFPGASLWLPVGRNSIGIGIKPGGRPWDFERIRERFEEDEIRSAMEAIGFPSPEALLATFVLDADAIGRFVGDSPLVTDDRPRLEFHDLSKAGQRFPAGDLLDGILRHRVDGREWLAARERDEGIDAARYERSVDALGLFFRGAFLFERNNVREAAAAWQRAREIEPDNAYYRSILGR